MTSTAARRRAIRRIIKTQSVPSQSTIVELLQGEGHTVTQATVSRDLNIIGAVKVRRPDGVYLYELADHLTKDIADRALTRALADFVLSLSTSLNIVILRTPPGGAHLVAGAIDHSGLEGVLGTVAGDDTVMVVCAESRPALDVAQELEQIGAAR